MSFFGVKTRARARKAQSFSFTRLPPYMLLEIGLFLPTKDIVRGQAINTFFNQQFRSKHLFKNIDIVLTDDDPFERESIGGNGDVVTSLINTADNSLVSFTLTNPDAREEWCICCCSFTIFPSCFSGLPSHAQTLKHVELNWLPRVDGELLKYLPETLLSFNAVGCSFSGGDIINLKKKMICPEFTTNLFVCDGCGEYDPLEIDYFTCDAPGCKRVYCEHCAFENPGLDFCEGCDKHFCLDFHGAEVSHCEDCGRSSCIECSDVDQCDKCHHSSCDDCDTSVHVCEFGCKRRLCLECDALSTYCDGCYRGSCSSCDGLTHCEVCDLDFCEDCKHDLCKGKVEVFQVVGHQMPQSSQQDQLKCAVA